MIRFLFKNSIPKRIASSFAIVILVGSFLLNLPISQSRRQKLRILTTCLQLYRWYVLQDFRRNQSRRRTIRLGK